MKTAIARAPGRIELLGNHTDYNQGLVLAAAIDRGVTITGRSRTEETVALGTKTLDRHWETTLKTITPTDIEPWANYPLGVVSEMMAAGFHLSGFEALISSTLPLGGGLSSSAALEVGVAVFLAQLHDFDLPSVALAKLCHRAETRFVGVPSGLLDQITCVFGRAGHAVFLDCKSEEIELVKLPPDVTFVIADSGGKHELVSSDYALRRQECTAAAQLLGVRSLRELCSAEVQAHDREIPPVLRRRALHITSENERVREAVQALAEGDAVRFGALMNASHESSRTNFENSTPRLDLLTGIARAIPGVLGARLTGGGFGGSAVILVKSEAAESIVGQLTREYRAETGIDAAPFVTRASDGAR